MSALGQPRESKHWKTLESTSRQADGLLDVKAGLRTSHACIYSCTHHQVQDVQIDHAKTHPGFLFASLLDHRQACFLVHCKQACFLLPYV
eukprot:1137762-Pelagomonas_calceolata.AAC.5